MLSKIKDRLLIFSKKGKQSPKPKIEYAYKGFSILLPADHMLPTYQQLHLKYDRFLPHLSKYIPHNATIIDVGANCGDTLAGMVEQNPHAKFICIEPDDAFHNELTSNINRITKFLPKLDVTVQKYLVGKSISNASLAGVEGSKHAIPGSGTQTSKPLDEILKSINCSPVKLLKIDVDGFDYDVIDSAHDLLVLQHPLLFFECQYEFDYQKAGYEKTITWLRSIDYTDWTIFDNFGEIVLRTNDIQQLFQLMEYIWKQNKKVTTRTIYYYDVLAATTRDKELIDNVLSTYAQCSTARPDNA